VKTERRLVPPCWAAFFCAAAGCNQDDYNVLENGVVVGRFFLSRSRRGGVPGCGITATSSARPLGRATILP
jgi:hypothetical protein